MSFLPVTPVELNGNTPDFVLVTGDAYVCHPSFGAAVIGRVLQSRGYSVAILAQPNWRGTADFTRFGRPRLGFLVTGGNIDSMVNHYTVALHKRTADAYSPNGATGLRPNRANIVYANRIREAYKDVPIILGGLEASLRRLAHYDYWDNAVRRSVLADSGADLLVYGMAENAIVEIADALASGLAATDLTFIDGTVFKTKDISFVENPIILPPFREIKEATSAGKKAYAQSFLTQNENTDYLTARILAEEYPSFFVVQNRPAQPLTQSEMDSIYALPYTRAPHPMYTEGVPAIEEIKFSITAQRGCFGGCSFCALNFHQGRFVQSRSHKSILAEAESFTHDPDFKGYIHDVGGPTANFRRPPCNRWSEKNAANPRPCRRNCLTPTPCPNLQYDHTDYALLLKKLREIRGVKKVFVRSGLRYDYLLQDPNGDAFLRELCAHHISGRLKVAPEHSCPKVLTAMNKPDFSMYEEFSQKYAAATAAEKKEQYLVPYLMSSHPGCTLNDAISLAETLRRTDTRPEQVQDFYPTPGTLSTCMYYTGIDPRTGQRIFTAKTAREKATQRALIQYRLPANYELVKNALEKTNRKDLIGYHPRALIRPKTAEKPVQKISQKTSKKPTKKKLNKQR